MYIYWNKTIVCLMIIQCFQLYNVFFVSIASFTIILGMSRLP